MWFLNMESIEIVDPPQKKMAKIRILLIEDNLILRDGITSMLNGQPDFKVVATIGSGNNVLIKARILIPISFS